MSTGWLLLFALGVAVVGGFLAAVYRGVARTARVDTRQDLIKLVSAPEIAKRLADVSNLPAYAFMAPFAEGRSHPFGWLWWRIEQDAEDGARYEKGWALTYRRARKAAGLPLSIRAQHTEITLAPGHQHQRTNE